MVGVHLPGPGDFHRRDGVQFPGRRTSRLAGSTGEAAVIGRRMNVCMVGHGMMGVWHTEALKETDCQLYMAVGRREEPLVQFSTKYGYRSWTTDFAAALADNNVDVVILANPSELHAQTALASIAAGKHVLVEIPIAMTLLDAERVVSAAESAGVTLGVVHPMRFRPEMVALRAPIQAGKEEVHHVCGRFFTA